jgi:hypothetical protein
MVCFETQNPKLGKIWRALDWIMLLYFMVIWNILRSFGIFYGIWLCCGNLAYFIAFGNVVIHNLIYFMAFGNVVIIWYILLPFGILCQGKSGNPGWVR